MVNVLIFLPLFFLSKNNFLFALRKISDGPRLYSVRQRVLRAIDRDSTAGLATVSTGPTSSSSYSVKRISDIENEISKRTAQSRRKMGPPQRKLKSPQDPMTGRVSVYCVGSSIDLQALRAHVFRRAFGRGSDGLDPEHTLSRRAENPQLDDEVLHVSNAPQIFTTNPREVSMLRKENSNSFLASSNEAIDSNRFSGAAEGMSSSSFPSGISDTSEEEDWKIEKALAMSTQDIFYFEYGCVVFWGLTPIEEKAALTELAAFTEEPVTPMELEDSFDTMEFVYDRSANPQRPVRFDRMKLRSLRIEEKLSLSYAMAQSSKLFVFESKVLQSLEGTRYLPKELAKEGKISCSKKQLNRLIGQLFVQQTEVNLFSSILDTPDFLWDDDEHVQCYQYTRSYLEVDDRVQLLNSRLSVIRELLDVLTAQVADSNSTRLEWIIIWLIAIEIVMGIASSPLFVGRRVVSAMLVPTAILFYKKIGDIWNSD